jgi:aminopeptidase-like protein
LKSSFFDTKKINIIFDKLFPISRSITGIGYRKSLNILSKYIRFKKLNYPTGKKVFDWVVPEEWVIKDAYIKKINEPNKLSKDKGVVSGEKIIDFKINNLHVVNYSAPVNRTMHLDALNKHLHSIKKYPKIIPYVTSYYKKNFGFCIQHSEREKLKNSNYKVVINSKFINGKVVNGLAKLKGRTNKIILISSYLCHPSMANNELSGPLVLLGLYEKIKKWNNRQYNYHFLINPETIGSICHIHTYKEIYKKDLDSGLVLTCLGGPQNKLSYKKSRIGNSGLDKLFINLSKSKKVFLREFDPTNGSDERQYCSSELNLPVGQVARTIYGQYYQYHTSADNKKFMKISQLVRSIDEIEKILKCYDDLIPLKRFMPYCEIQLGKRNLYPNINSYETKKKSSDNLNDFKEQLKIIQYILSYADGKNNIIDIANVSGIDIFKIKKILNICIEQKIIK